MTKQAKRFTQGDCMSCGPNIRASIKAMVPWLASKDDISVWETHYLLECGGCGQVYYQRISQNSEDGESGSDGWEPNEVIVNWPGVPLRKRPEWFGDLLAADYDLYTFMGEVYDALEARLRIVAAIGMRTAIDRATEVLGIPASDTFKDKLKKLEDGGYVGKGEREHIETMVDAGSAAAHRGWRPDEDDLAVLMSELETFVHRNFLADAQLKKVKSKVPQKSQTKLQAQNQKKSP